MDTVTHSLLGALVVRSVFPARLSKRPLNNRQRMLIGGVAGAFPDIDYVMSWVDPMVYLTLWHRSVTHSLVLLPLWAVMIGVIMAFGFRRRSEWRFIGLLAGVSLLSHILSDLITVYGTQILAPLSGWRASIGTTFVIDPWFSLIVLIGCIAGWRNGGGRLPQLGLATLVVFVAMQGVLKAQAIFVARAYADTESLAAEIVTAFPQPLSPFNWKLLIKAGQHYHVSYLNLAGGYAVDSTKSGFWAELRRTYRGQKSLAWERHARYGGDPRALGGIRRLWEDPQLDHFRRFAAFPVLYRIDRTAQNTCVWFTDLRYVLPYLTPPFRYGLCRTAARPAWSLDRLMGSR